MKVLSASEIREADAYTIAHEPIASIDLMERAAAACFEWIIRHIKNISLPGGEGRGGAVKIFCGTGNNGGDGLVIARMLHGDGCAVEVYAVRFSEKSSEDFCINEERLKKAGLELKEIRSEDEIPEISKDDIVIDAIFGSGLARPVKGFTAGLIYRINNSCAEVLAVDVPSGLFCEDNSENIPENIIRASHTLTFQAPKLAFLFPENEKYVGEWHVIPIGLNLDFISQLPSRNYLITGELIKMFLKPRNKFSHKGTYGHALLIAGSYGKMGAAVLTAAACLRSGAGLVTARIPKSGNEIMQTALPEAMLDLDEHEERLTSPPVELNNYSAIGIGPGIGTEEQTQNMLKSLIQNTAVPLVIDADAINILGENKTWLSFVPQESIYTPHPKEFERLSGASTHNFERFRMQVEFARKHSVYLVLKGAHTAIACPDGEVYFNTTGNPGMATGGSGDVLTGIITGLLAQGYGSRQAAVLGVYLHGFVGDMAAGEIGREAMLAGDLVKGIGDGFKSLKQNA